MLSFEKTPYDLSIFSSCTASTAPPPTIPFLCDDVAWFNRATGCVRAKTPEAVRATAYIVPKFSCEKSASA